MSDIIYNSYNYSLERKFEPLADRKKLKNQPFTQVPQERNEAEAFFTENISSSVGLTKIVFTNKNGWNDSKYSREYLTFEALEDTTFTFTRNNLQYSVDGGETWETLAANTETPTITAGNKIMWKQTGLTPEPGYGIGTFSSTGNFNVSGNIMSLYYGDEFIGQKDLTGKISAFYVLFFGCNKLVNAENLILPATTLEQNCYVAMFQGCTSLITAPELPATTLADNCYNSMFYGCTSLTKAPELPATTLTNSCYQWMFEGCTSLNYIKCLATDISASNCTSTWVENVNAEGTFIADSAEVGWFYDNSGIPSGWDAFDKDGNPINNS